MQPASVGVALHQYLMWVPIVLLGAGILLSTRFHLDAKAHQVLLGEIDRLKDGGNKQDVDPQVRQVCETLTGQAYESLWRAT